MIKQIVREALNVGENIRSTLRNASDLNIKGTVDSYLKSVPGVYALGKLAPIAAKGLTSQLVSTGVGGKLSSAVLQTGKLVGKSANWWLQPVSSTAKGTITKVASNPLLAAKTAGTIGLAIAADSAVSAITKSTSLIDFGRALFNKDKAGIEIQKGKDMPLWKKIFVDHPQRHIFRGVLKLVHGGTNK